jgi:hypothetical protein
MRRLHAVGKQEIFVASGLYEFEQNGAKIGLTESWSIHEVGGAQFIRVDQDGRTHDGRSILYEALRNPNGELERVDLRAYGNAQDAFKEIRASYTFFEDHVEIIRVVNRLDRYDNYFEIPAGYVIQPGAIILNGMMIPQMNRNEVIIFAIDANFTDLNFAFEGYGRRAGSMELIDRVQIEQNGKPYSARLYQSENKRVWLDPFDILLREEFASQIITLRQYARRPEPQTHD